MTPTPLPCVDAPRHSMGHGTPTAAHCLGLATRASTFDLAAACRYAVRAAAARTRGRDGGTNRAQTLAERPATAGVVLRAIDLCRVSKGRGDLAAARARSQGGWHGATGPAQPFAEHGIAHKPVRLLCGHNATAPARGLAGSCEVVTS